MKCFLSFVFLLASCFLSLNAFAQPKYEFRAVWIASVENIDWPSKKGLSVPEQKEEFIHILNMHQRNGMNAVIVQIRPEADALYQSTYEPWSEYLNGSQGMPPVPYYDPLKFMIDETHKRGMEFHAWLNPYRAVFNIYSSSIAPNHITRQHPDWFITYNKQKIFDPGNPAVIDYVSNIVKDIVMRYDVDGIHLDDYFYPYPAAGKEFPDEKNYRLYGRGKDKKEWRRSNCDSIIKRIHETILAVKPMIKFGVSPFGVWRNQNKDSSGSNTHAGISNYDDLYADILLWLKMGWIDYAAPQLYWEIGHKLCDYQTLINWWSEHSYGRQIFVGHAMYRAGLSTVWRNKNELPQEVQLTRETPNIWGSIYFSSKDFYRNPNGFNDSLRDHYYKTPALIPPMNWIDTTSPATPAIINSKDDKTFIGNIIKISGEVNDTSSTETIKNFVLYISNDSATLGNTPFFISAVDSAKQHHFSFNIYQQQIPADWVNCYIAVSSVDRENNESLLSNKVAYTKTELGWKIKQNKSGNELSRNVLK